MHALLSFFSAAASKTDALLQEPTLDVTPTSYIREKKFLLQEQPAPGRTARKTSHRKTWARSRPGTATCTVTRRTDKRSPAQPG